MLVETYAALNKQKLSAIAPATAQSSIVAITPN